MPVADAGETPLRKASYEAFAQNVAAGMLLIDAWCSATSAEVTPGRRVSASKVHARPEVLNRIAHLRRTLKATGAPDSLKGHHLSELMETVTSALTRAAEVAARTGASYAQQSAIRKGIVMHAGRTTRLEANAPAPEPSAAEMVIHELQFCSCDTAS